MTCTLCICLNVCMSDACRSSHAMHAVHVSGHVYVCRRLSTRVCTCLTQAVEPRAVHAVHHPDCMCVRLMQAVDHPYLVVHSASAPGAAEAQKKLLEEEAQGLMQGTCGVCHDHLEDPVMSSCQHVFCRACMMEYMEGAQGQAKCPSCEKPLSVDLSASAAVSPFKTGCCYFSACLFFACFPSSLLASLPSSLLCTHQAILSKTAFTTVLHCISLGSFDC